MKLAALLLLLVAAVHYGLEPLSHVFSDAPAAHRAMFYIGQGVKGFALWCAVAWLAYSTARSKGMNAFTAAPLFAVCAWGAIEDFEVAACRLARGIESIPMPGPWQGVCDELTGLPLYMLGLFAGLLTACIVDYGSKKDDQRNRDRG